MRFFDTHSHPQFHDYAEDREEVFSRMKDERVSTIVVGTHFSTSKEAVALARNNSGVFACIGVHPNDSEEMFNAGEFKGLLDEKVVAIGECGLDYFRSSAEVDGARQKENFETQIRFAVEHDLPLMLHVRSSKGSQDAHEEAQEILRSYQKENGERIRGTSHFFTGSLEIARGYWDMGFAVSFPGVITFARDYDEVVRQAPESLMLSETDAPYATPVPFRGKRNEPAYVVEVVRRIAQIRGVDMEVAAEQLFDNACRIFKIRAESCA